MLQEPAITLSRRGAERLIRGHPWIYRGDLERVPAGLEGGDIVAAKDARGRFLGKAFWSSRSKIALRMVTRDEVPIDDAFFAERIGSAISLRDRIFPGEPSVRLVHGEADLLPGLVVDRFGDVAVIQTLVPATDRRKQSIADVLVNTSKIRTIVERNDVKVRELEGLPQVKGVIRGADPGLLEYQEGVRRMKLDVLGGQKTGAFLDQRENRLRAGEYASGRCLDCFSYAGAFALQLSLKADQVIAVEQQAPAVRLARENVALNGADNVEVIEANAFDYLRDASEREPEFDLVVLDPPAFAKNKDALAAARRGYKEINLRAIQSLKPGGLLVTASCSYHLAEAMLEEIVFDAARDAGRAAQILEKRGASRDHPVLMGVPETRYLKCFVVRLP